MSQIAKRAVQVSDGLASMAHKRMKSLVSELQKEGAITKSESSTAVKRLGQVKTDLYDRMSREFKRLLVDAEKKSRSKPKSKSSKKSRR